MRLLQFLLVCAFLSPALPAAADDGDVIARWYEALAKVDRDGLAALLAADAKIEMQDLDIVQTRDEFMSSLDEWEAASEGLHIRHRQEGMSEGMSVSLVCYEFPGSQLMTRESFLIEGELIHKSVQSGVADDCSEF